MRKVWAYLFWLTNGDSTITPLHVRSQTISRRRRLTCLGVNLMGKSIIFWSEHVKFNVLVWNRISTLQWFVTTFVFAFSVEHLNYFRFLRGFISVRSNLNVHLDAKFSWVIIVNPSHKPCGTPQLQSYFACQVSINLGPRDKPWGILSWWFSIHLSAQWIWSQRWTSHWKPQVIDSISYSHWGTSCGPSDELWGNPMLVILYLLAQVIN